ncbi:50S ribosomal protein L10 [Bienertia sinuspersici]
MGGDRAYFLASILGYQGHTRVDADGFSGGIWLYWKPNLVSISVAHEHHQHIIVEITRNGETPWYFSVIYASPDPLKRRDLWEELKNFAATNNKLWLLAGDFNDTRYDWERNESFSETYRRYRLFNQLVHDMELVEVEKLTRLEQECFP